MGIRVVARIRPQQQHELDTDVIVTAVENDSGDPSTLVKVPSHKNDNEVYTFAFSGVYDQLASQQSIFDNEGWSRKKTDLINDLTMLYVLILQQWRQRSNIF